MPEVCEMDQEFQGTKCKVDNRIVLLWMTPVIAFVALVWLAFLTLLSSQESFIQIFGGMAESLIALLMLSAILVIPAFVWFTLRHRAISYTITETEVIINEGVINKKRAVIPFIQVQDVHIKRPVLYRIFGLSLIDFETAGGARGGSLHGVANANETVKILIERVKAIRASGADSETRADDHKILFEVLEELRSLKERVEQNKSCTPEESNKLREIQRKTEKLSEGYPGKVGLKEEIFRILEEKEEDELLVSRKNRRKQIREDFEDEPEASDSSP